VSGPGLALEAAQERGGPGAQAVAEHPCVCFAEQVLAESLAAFVGHPAYNTDALRADLHRYVFLLGISDGEELFGEPTP